MSYIIAFLYGLGAGYALYIIYKLTAWWLKW